jgi:hypothetical protein
MKRLTKLLSALLVLGVAGPASAVQFKFNGDLNHRFMLYTDQAGLYSGSETIGTIAAPGARIADGTVGETWGEIKYRLTVEAATDDGGVRGVYGIELGAIRFGDRTAGTAGQRGGGYSGDGNNYETRFAYVDFAVRPKHRLQIGLQPFLVNKYLWSETAMGVSFKGQGGPATYQLAWMRGNEVFNTATQHQQFRDADNLLLRGDFAPMKDAKVGVFGLYQHSSPEFSAAAGPPAVNATRSHLLKNFNGVEYDLYNIGADAAMKFGQAFVNADLIFQGGTSTAPNVVAALAAEQDHMAYFAHLDVGYNLGKARITYTGWYASGDDDAADTDTENFIATDVDISDSIILQEGGYTDDNYFTEAPYFLSAGAFFHKLALDYKASDKLTLSGAVMYIMTAEDVGIGTGATADTSKYLGTEVDAAIAYKLNPNLELAVNGGYLISGDAMDAWEVNKNGEADRNIFRTTARARYTF